MIQVFPTNEIPHKWAHQTQESARNPGGNLYFKGATIYSYRDSWPLARIYGPKRDGSRLVLTNCERYSKTTAAHQSAANTAVSHWHATAVPHVQGAYGTELSKAEHTANFAYIIARADEALKRAQRAMQSATVAWRRSHAEHALKDAQRYSDFFGLRRKVPAFPEIAWNAAAARAERIENPDPASLDKRERASAARKAAQEARERKARELAAPRLAALRTDWRLFGAFGAAGPYARPNGPVMLRVNQTDETIETSMGVRVPLAAAPMVWNMVQRARKQGGMDGRQGGVLSRAHPVRLPRIGDYPLDRIEADGTLVAGCHTIPYSELSALARALGLEGQS